MRLQIEDRNHGKIVVIDIEKRVFEVADNTVTASEEAIALALELNADLLLIDERRDRAEVARLAFCVGYYEVSCQEG